MFVLFQQLYHQRPFILNVMPKASQKAETSVKDSETSVEEDDGIRSRRRSVASGTASRIYTIYKEEKHLPKSDPWPTKTYQSSTCPESKRRCCSLWRVASGPSLEQLKRKPPPHKFIPVVYIWLGLISVMSLLYNFMWNMRSWHIMGKQWVPWLFLQRHFWFLKKN